MTAAAKPPVLDLPTVLVHKARVHAVTEPRCIEAVVAAMREGRGGVIITPNLDHARRIAHDPGYAALVEAADLVVADGMPLIWASRIAGTPLPERVAGSNLITSLSAALGREGRSIFLLGGSPGTADRAASVLKERCPGLVIAGTRCPDPGFEKEPAQVETLKQALHAANPDLVYVALGSPKQERLIQQIRGVLPGAWWIGVGISFSFLCGDVRRAPRWMQKVGLEWFHRLLQEPRRLARRYLIEGIPYMAVLTAWAVRRRLGS